MTLFKSKWFLCMAAAIGLAILLATAPVSAGPTTASSRPFAKIRSKIHDLYRQTRPAGQAPRVTIGMHILRMISLDITNNQFELDFWLWFRWTDDSIKPYESFELVNGTINSRQVEGIEKVNGENYACLRIQATLTCFWDVSRFPLGTQRLTVEIEDNDLEADQLIYVPDSKNCGVDDNFRVAGWLLNGFSCDAVTHRYATNYGDPRHPSGEKTFYSRVIFAIQLNRADVFHSFKIFSGLYLSALVAFTVFFVKPDYRLPLIVGAVFAVVASHTVISSYLPEAGVLTLADKLHLVTAGVILIALFEAAYALHLLHKGRETIYKRLDWVTFWITFTLFIAANVWFLTR